LLFLAASARLLRPVNHLRFTFRGRRFVLAVATAVVCAIGVGVLTGAGGLPQPAAGDPYYCGFYNFEPRAHFDYSPVPPRAGEVVTFTSTATDPEGEPLETAWDFNGDWDPTPAGLSGDGSGIDQRGNEARFTYAAPGDYSVRMGVQDPCRGFDAISRVVRVEAAGGAALDTSGPRVVIPRVNRTRRVSRTGVFTFILGPFLEDVTGTVGFRSVAAVVSRQRRNTRKRLKLGAKPFSVAQGGRAVVSAKLPKKGRRALRQRRRLRMRARVVLRDTLGNASSRSFRFTLKPRRR
jgi:PKD domain-containing protein